MLIVNKKVKRGARSQCFGTEMTETCVKQNTSTLLSTEEFLNGDYISATYRRNNYKVDGKFTYNANEVRRVSFELTIDQVY